jgi:hypothetical protein
MLLKSFHHFPNYHTIDIYNFSLDKPLNNWSRGKAKKFSWRPESVSFETKSDCFLVSTNIYLEEVVKISSEAKRAILVPFYVNKDLKIGFSELVFDENDTIELCEGWYRLLFCDGWSGEGNINQDNSEWCDLKFIPSEKPMKSAVIYAHEDYPKEDLPLVVELEEDDPA